MRPPELSETALALEVAERHGPDHLYIKDTGQWFCWNGKVWQPDHEALILSHCASVICCDGAQYAQNESQARSLASRRTQQAVVNLIKTDPRMVITHDRLDANPMLLGTPDGVVDLEQESDLLKADRSYLITMSTSVAPAPPGTPHPIWDAFLRTTFPLKPGEDKADEEKIEFVQRIGGYQLTGLTVEENLLFDLGRGRNGKGTLTQTKSAIWGDYAYALPGEALLLRNYEPHRCELAMLRGKRLILSNEVGAGQTWNQSRLSELTGGDPITANYMRCNPFEFRPVGKLEISANHPPRFESVDTYIEERLLLLRFLMRFVKRVDKEHPSDIAQRDNTLKARLRLEYPAILRWHIEVARKWQRDGLQVPDSVLTAGKDYLDVEDALGAFVKENCTPIDAHGPLSELHEVWNMRRREEHEKLCTLQEFRKLIEDRYGVSRANYGMKVQGLALNDTARAQMLKAREAREAARAASNGTADPR